MVEAFIVFLIVCTLIALIDISALPLELGLIQFLRFVFKKLGLYGATKDTATDDNSLDSYIGSTATTQNDFQKGREGFFGYVVLNGVKWDAVCESEKLPPNIVVQVVRQKNLLLTVKKI